MPKWKSLLEHIVAAANFSGFSSQVEQPLFINHSLIPHFITLCVCVLLCSCSTRKKSTAYC
jgi:hypothetical protein